MSVDADAKERLTLARVAGLLEADAAALTRRWVEQLTDEGNPLVTGPDRDRAWSNAAFWLSMLIEGLRHPDPQQMAESVSLTVSRLVALGIPPSASLGGVLALRRTVCEHVAGALDEGDPLECCLLLGRLFDEVTTRFLAGLEQAAAPPPRTRAAVAPGQALLNRLARAVANQRDPDALLERLLTTAATLGAADKGVAAFVEEDSGRLVLSHAYRLPLDELLQWWQQHPDHLLPPACAEQRPIAWDDLAAADEDVRDLAARFGVHRALVLPVLAADRCLAVIALFDPSAPEVWSPSQLALINDLLAQGGAALLNLRLLQAAKERARELARLNQAAVHFAELTDVPQLLQAALIAAVDITGAAGGMLWRPANGTWHADTTTGAAPQPPALPADFVGPLLEGGQPTLAGPEQLAASPLAALTAPQIAFMPVFSGDQPRALLGLLAPPAGSLSGGDIEMLSALQHQLALSLRNTELLESSRQLTDRLRSAMDSLGAALASSLDTEDMLRLICGLLLDLTQGDGALAFLQEDGGEMRPITGVLAEGGSFEPPADLLACIAGLAVAKREWVEAQVDRGEVSPAARDWLLQHDLHSVLVVPLLVKEETIGACALLRRSPHPLAQADRQVVITFVGQAAVGLENVQLFQAMQRRLVELADFTWVSSKMTGTLEQGEILRTIVAGVQKALNLPIVFVSLLDAEQQLSIPADGHFGLSPALVAHLRVSPRFSPLAQRVIDSRVALVVPELAQSEFAADPLLHDLPGARSVMAVPLGSGRQEVFGLLCVADTTRRAFNSHDETLLSIYANQAALALQNAENYQAVVRHVQELETVLEVTKTLISSLELDDILQHLLQAVTRLLTAPVASLMLLDESTGELVTKAAIGLPLDHPLLAKTKVGENIPGIVARTGQPIASRQISRDGRFRARDAARSERLQSMLCVPLVTRGKVRGVLNIFTRRLHDFTEAEMRLLTTVASEAGVAIENAELYTAAREQARSTRVLMEEVNHRIKNNLQAILGIVQLQLGSAPVEPVDLHEVLPDIIARIQAIAVVHELLLEEDVREVDVRESARRILDNARAAAARPDLRITGQVVGARVRLTSRKATAVALVINELVYNAIKHAFPGRSEGSIVISMQEVGGRDVLIQVKDDGVGLPPGFDIERNGRLGLQIVQGMVRQDLQGEFTLASNGGTIARVLFSK